MKTHRPEHKDATGRPLEVRAFALQLKAVGDGGQFEGYGSVFNVRDQYDDVIAPGAFRASLAAHKQADTMPALLWQHDPHCPVGIYTSMEEDSKGLYCKGQLALQTVKGAEAFALLKLGAINGLSIGFRSKVWTYDENTDIRTLSEIELWEVSLVTFPANQEARVTSVKDGLDAWRTPKDAERALREAGFSKADATALVARVMRMGEERRDSAKSIAHAQSAAQRLLTSLTTPH